MGVKDDIDQEMKRVRDEIDEQKNVIKHYLGNTLAVETAEQQMKALHTRLSVLKTNLAKAEG